MELADLLRKISVDIEGIANLYKYRSLTEYTMENLFSEVINKMREYQINNFLFDLDVRVKTENDLIISFESEGIDVGFLYLHKIKYKLIFNVDIHPLRR